jgi:hypothetical protein
LPEYQLTGVALAGFSELLERATAEHVDVVDAYMRDSTSYPVVMRGKDLIEAAYGYRASELAEPSDDTYGSWLPNYDSGLFDSELEQDHHVVLIRQMSADGQSAL